MKNYFSQILDIVTQSPRRVYYSGKKAIFMLLLAIGLSFYFPTIHNGDLFDVIWSNFYIIGPSIIGLTVMIMWISAHKELKKSL